MIEPYKGRAVDHRKRVEVYRNLTRSDGVWYSVRQDGRVVGHTQWIHLKECYYKVQEGGRQRVLRTGHKNVHAFVLGLVMTKPSRYDLGYPHEGRYRPQEMSSFQMLEDGQWRPVICSMEAELSVHGLTIWMPRA